MHVASHNRTILQSLVEVYKYNFLIEDFVTYMKSGISLWPVYFLIVFWIGMKCEDAVC